MTSESAPKTMQRRARGKSSPVAATVNLEEAEDRVEGGREQRSREKRRDGARRLAVRIRQPRVHRRETDLRPESDGREQERRASRSQTGRLGAGVRADVSKRGQVGVAERAGAGRVQEIPPPSRAIAEPAGGDQHVLPGRLERGVRPVERDEERPRRWSSARPRPRAWRSRSSAGRAASPSRRGCRKTK